MEGPFLTKIKGILPDDGRHDQKPDKYAQKSEWCERCEKEFPLGSTKYYENICRWLCLRCAKEVRKGKELYIKDDL